jgi:hypothetical protein
LKEEKDQQAGRDEATAQREETTIRREEARGELS